jgi:malate dehydrogenase (oxaloacetate-decarboxylating)
MTHLVEFNKEEVFEYHQKERGKISIKVKTPIANIKDLSLAYTPGVAEVCLRIQKNPESVYQYTNLENLVAIVTNGTRILGLGDIGPHAGLPVMEGKSVLFKKFAGIDAFPICLGIKDPIKMIETVKNLEHSFSGINLEDIRTPDCFEIESKLIKMMNIPVFHDDQHGTAVVLLAALINALKFVGKKFKHVKVAIAGAGAAGTAIAKILLRVGIEHVLICDSAGIIYEGREGAINNYKEELARLTNKEKVGGSLGGAVKGADVFVGASIPNIVDSEMVKSMNDDAIVFALANPIPEIMPEEAEKGGARIIGTGRSDYPNQINNLMGFPGIFRGALDVRASKINEEMKIAAARAIANLMTEDALSEESIIVNPLYPNIVANVAFCVAKAAMKTKVARIILNDQELKRKIERNILSI